MIVIRPSTERDDPDIVAIRNAIYADRILDTVDDFRTAIRSQPPEAHAQSYVAERDGRVVGTLWLNRLLYVDKPSVWWADIMVRPDAHGQGIGIRLYDALLERLADAQAQEVRGHVREDLSLARRFVRSRGFQETGHGARPSRLEIRRANTDAGRAAAERLRGEGIRIATLEELGETDDLLHRLHALANQIGPDLPYEADRTEMKVGPLPRVCSRGRSIRALLWSIGATRLTAPADVALPVTEGPVLAGMRRTGRQRSR